MKLRERVGLNIQNLRNSRGLSQEQLALAADMDRSYVSEIELAKFSASLDVLERIAVTSRKVIWLFLEQLWIKFVPVFHGLQGRLASQG